MRFAREVAQQVVFLDHGHLLEAARPADFFDTPRSDRLRSFLKQVL
jgi:ABC-type histidine transport system ATPase subunit